MQRCASTLSFWARSAVAPNHWIGKIVPKDYVWRWSLNIIHDIYFKQKFKKKDFKNERWGVWDAGQGRPPGRCPTFCVITYTCLKDHRHSGNSFNNAAPLLRLVSTIVMNRIPGEEKNIYFFTKNIRISTTSLNWDTEASTDAQSHFFFPKDFE